LAFSGDMYLNGNVCIFDGYQSCALKMLAFLKILYTYYFVSVFNWGSIYIVNIIVIFSSIEWTSTYLVIIQLLLEF